MNVDDMRARDAGTEISSRIPEINADIACVNETHDAITAKSQLGGYVICQGKAKGENNQETIPNKRQITNPINQKMQSIIGKGGRADMSQKLNTTQNE